MTMLPLMTTALEMLVAVASCSSAALEEDSMSGTKCCNMNTRKVGRARDFDTSGPHC